MSSYQPIDCAIHSQLELHIMHADTLDIEWYDDEQTLFTQQVQPMDIISRHGEGEFLQYRDEQGVVQELRLDRIAGFKLPQ